MSVSGLRRRTDSTLAWFLGAAVGIMSWLSGNNLEIPPELWDEISVAAGLRPPPREFPLLWQNCLSFFISEFGLAPCLEALKVAGAVSLGLLTAVVFRLFALCLPEVMRTDMVRTRRGRWTVRLVLVQGALFLSCSEPVWLAGRILSPEMTALLLSAAAFLAAASSVEKSSYAGVIFTCVLSGALTAETPLGVLPAALCAFSLRRECGDPAATPSPLATPLVAAVTARRMTLAFICGWIGMLAVNLAFFRASGGGAEDGIYLAVTRYVFGYFTLARSAMSPTGFLLAAAVAVLPLVIITALTRGLSDPERFLPLPHACFAAVAGGLAFMQSTGFAGCRFWDWDSGAAGSGYALCMCVFATSLTAVKVVGIFTVDVFFRNHVRLLRETFPGAVENEPLAARVLRILGKTSAMMRVPARFEPLLALALVVPFRFDPAVREMSSIVNGIARQTAAECAGVPVVFTDGSIDAAVEAASAQAGRSLKAISMMAGSGKYEKALRLRGETDEETRSLLGDGASDAVRVWVHGGHDRATNIAVQVGLELWRNSDLPVPGIGGLVAKTAGFPDGESERRAEEARALAGRILGFCAENDVGRCGYQELRKMFHFCQWRLSRMCRMRANEAESKGDAHASEREHALADRLDRCNPQWREVQDRMLALHWRGDVRLTPDEGLKLALKRADFRMAKPFAERILSSDPENMQANFAMAMGCFIGKRYLQAEKHLEKCLLRSPDEPAVLNNLAVVQLRLGKLDAAETNALKALEQLKDSSEVKSTLRHIRSARKIGQ